MAFVSLSMAAVLMAAGQQSTFPPTRVAVVSVPDVSTRYERTRDLEAQFEQKRAKFNEQRDALRGKMERTGRSLQEELKPGTEEFEQRRKQLAMYEAELKWLLDSGGQKIELEIASSLRSIYMDIQGAVREVAEQRGIDVVLAADQLPEERPQTTTQVRQQIILQKVVYWNSRVDVTDAVVERLNERYRARKLAAPSGGARPPLSGEGDVTGK